MHNYNEAPMTSLTLPNILVSSGWLKEHLGHPQLVVLDASAHMPNTDRNAEKEWREGRIPHARFFDISNRVCDPSSDLPHMLPPSEVFTQEIQKLGINQNSIVIVYDSLGIFSAPRAWWMFTAMGHKQCAVLDGGLPDWKVQGGNIDQTSPPTKIEKGNFIAEKQRRYIKNKEQMLAAINNESISILDARPKARFDGSAPEPRTGLSSGHIPHSKNIPFNDLLINGKFKDIDSLKQLLKPHINSQQALYTSCGSGITACIIAFARRLCGYSLISVYDGSWAEWGQPKFNLPIDTQ